MKQTVLFDVYTFNANIDTFVIMNMFLRSIYFLTLIILLCKYKKVTEANFLPFFTRTHTLGH